MKNTKIIQSLREFNEWRRSGEGEQPNPKEIGKVIDRALRRLEKHEAELAICNANCSLSDDIIDSGKKELMFANMHQEALRLALEEISVMTSDKFTKKVADTAIERHKTDKLIHALQIFGNDQVGIDMSNVF